MKSSRRTRFYFFLNPYADMAFTRCPKCEAKTKQKKLPLVIHIEPQTLFVLNKTCRFCPACELVIARESEIEPLLAAIVEERQSRVDGKDYIVIGTLDRADWRAGQKGLSSPGQVVDQAWLFKNHWDFEVRGGWMPADDAPRR